MENQHRIVKLQCRIVKLCFKFDVTLRNSNVESRTTKIECEGNFKIESQILAGI